MSINFVAPINFTGYGHTGFHLTQAMSKFDSVSLFPISSVDQNLNTDIIKKSIDNASLFDNMAPCIRLWHQFDMSQFVGHGPHIGFPIFELDTFTAREKHHLGTCDYLFVCSEWAKQICIKNGLDGNRIFIVPLGVDRDIFTDKPANTHGPTIFFNIGKWEKRKGHDVLIKAFNRAFTKDDNVLLLMCCTNPFLTPAEEVHWIKLYQNPKVRLVSRLPSQSEVAKLIQSADCGVFPARAEGWNLEALETLSCGRELIITNYSAHTEFCNSDNSRLIEIDDIELAHDGKWFFNNGNWAKLDDKQIDAIAAHMKDVHSIKQSSKLSTNSIGVETANNFTWNNAALKIMEHLNDIAKA